MSDIYVHNSHGDLGTNSCVRLRITKKVETATMILPSFTIRYTMRVPIPFDINLYSAIELLCSIISIA